MTVFAIAIEPGADFAVAGDHDFTVRPRTLSNQARGCVSPLLFEHRLRRHRADFLIAVEDQGDVHTLKSIDLVQRFESVDNYTDTAFHVAGTGAI